MPSKLSFRFLAVICFLLHVDSQLQIQQLDLLLKLKQYWKDPPSMSHWNSLNNHCSWPEITCTGGSVTALKLPYVIHQPGATIPPFICDFNNITSIDLSDNSFHGEFPTPLYNCTKLTHLDLSLNSFSGPIPSDIHHMASLQTLYLRTNKFSSIHTNIGQLDSLQILDLSANLLTGNLPDSVFSLKNLMTLDLSTNSLSGEIPEVTAAFNLSVIDLSWNNFEGRIPQGFGKLRKLSFLSLVMNKLSGEIPKSIAYLPALTTILLYLNDFSGTLPPALGEYSPLTELQVFSNRLTGAIPESLGNCSSLTTLSINSNRFTGRLPKNFCTKGNLVTLDASNNNLGGAIPESLGNCSSLTTLSINSNRFTGRLPKNFCTKGNLVTLDASNNNLSGEPFESLSNCSKLVTLRLNSNIFSGRIPAHIYWKRIDEFRASNNKISGPIPKNLASLPYLRVLDLSENQLSGPIPDQLGEMHLYFLNLSSNHLVGRVPHKLRNSSESFLNNPGLSSSKLTSNVVISIVSASVVAACFGALLLYIIVVKLCSNRKGRRIKPTLAWKFIPFHVLSFRESNILSGMTEDNVVGQGGSGKVYRVWLGGTEGFVAVKRICSKGKVDQNLEKQFLAEVDILGKIRHLNIVKLLCCISSDSSKLLVYEYLENRSLDWWLHGNNWGSGNSSDASLVWPMRLKIAIGAAQGLCYLHHDCSPPIIHRDVKSANILLDAEFNAKVADFGLAKLVTTVGEANTASAVAGSFGYIAPEYARTKRLNQKIDVYSFGVVLLELTTGRKANAGDEHTGLAQWAWRQMEESNNIPDALDENIQNSPDHVEEMVNVFKLGIICTGMFPSSRPSMKEVLQILLSFHLQN